MKTTRAPNPLTTDGKPIVLGLGATYEIGSDCYALTVARLVSAVCVELRFDQVAWHDGQATCTPDPGGRLMVARKGKTAWRQQGRRCGAIHFGSRRQYLDLSS